jgi:imidazolonepropionase-like amidohydrolase
VAERGIALTPTLSVIMASLAEVRNRPDSPRKDWYVAGASVHGRLTAAAVEAGVTVLAGTDSRPHGRIADEVRAFVATGVSPHQALAAASWGARSYLGIGGLAEGAPADAVVFDTDPRADLSQLNTPRAVVVRGRLVRRHTRQPRQTTRRTADMR